MLKDYFPLQSFRYCNRAERCLLLLLLVSIIVIIDRLMDLKMLFIVSRQHSFLCLLSSPLLCIDAHVSPCSKRRSMSAKTNPQKASKEEGQRRRHWTKKRKKIQMLGVFQQHVQGGKP